MRKAHFSSTEVTGLASVFFALGFTLSAFGSLSLPLLVGIGALLSHVARPSRRGTLATASASIAASSFPAWMFIHTRHDLWESVAMSIVSGAAVLTGSVGALLYRKLVQSRATQEGQAHD